MFFQCKKLEHTPVNFAPVKKVIDTLYGQKIEDPYRYMENLNDTTVIKWFKSQNNYSNRIIKNISGYEKLKEKITNLKKSTPFTISKYKVTNNDSYFYLKQNSDEDNPSLYYRKGFLGKEKKIFTPKENYLINYIQPSWDGLKIAIGITKNDKEFSNLIVIEVASKKILKGIANNSFPNSLGGVDWLPDNTGFIYTYIPIIDSRSKGYLHNSQAVIYKINEGDTPLKDIFSKKNNPKINFKEQDFPLIYLTNSKNKFTLGAVAGVASYRDTYFIETDDLINGENNWKSLFKKEEEIKQFIINNEDFIYRTSKNATNYKICKTSLLKPNFNNPTVLVSEDSTSVITDLAITSKGLFYVKTKNGVDAKLYHFKNDNIEYIDAPKASGKINISSKGSGFSDLWITMESWISKKERYYYNYETKTFKEENLNVTSKISELDNVVIKEIEITSHDGIKVPLSIIHKENIALNSNNRLLINGYGAYGYSQKPILNNYLLQWVNEGGIYAVAHVRGGGEKGNMWRTGGFKTTKPNTWKDFIACTEYLIKHKYSSPKKIAIWGRSAGGILIGRAITERPDLYKAAVIQVGKINTLRSEFGQNGKNSIKEYGTVKDSIEFKALLEMDAYHHIKNNVEYPSIYLTAGLNDARVPAWQPGKFAARLQEATTSNNPILLSVDFEGGHGFDASQDKKNKKLTDILSFAFWQTGHPDFQPKK